MVGTFDKSLEVVLADLTIDLEVCALVRCLESTETTETIVLQRLGNKSLQVISAWDVSVRNARGGTFVGALDSKSDRCYPGGGCVGCVGGQGGCSAHQFPSTAGDSSLDKAKLCMQHVLKKAVRLLQGLKDIRSLPPASATLVHCFEAKSS